MILHGNCLDILPMLDADSFDSVVTDPPYGLTARRPGGRSEATRGKVMGGFMGMAWDADVPSVDIWREVYRVLKPGAHLLAFFGTRTYHRGVINIEDAGFEIRDQVQWLYAQGFAKSHSVSLALWKGVLDCQSKNNAPLVVQLSKFTPLVCAEAKESIVAAPALILPEGAPALIIQTGEEGGTLGLTVTSLSASQAESISLSTGWSWAKSSVESLDPRNISTTETSGKAITDQRISTSLTSSLTQKFTPRNVILQNGWTWPAVSVEALSPDAYTSSNDIPIVTVAEIATWNPVAQHKGVGTGLKPANEPIVVARKPLAVPQEAPGGETYDADTPERPVRMRAATVAENVLAHGVGGLNIDGCRIASSAEDKALMDSKASRKPTGKTAENVPFVAGVCTPANELGRWPANVITDGSDEVLAAFPDAPGQQGDLRQQDHAVPQGNAFGQYGPKRAHPARVEIDKSAARFFYVAKASKKDRNDGLEDFAAKPSAASEFRPNHTEKAEQGEDGNPYGRWKPLKNNHPTVKPTDLMRYLCRLVTPPGGKVLDPFAGSGSTGRGAVLEGFQFTGIEMSEEYVEIARARIAAARKRYEDEVYL